MFTFTAVASDDDIKRQSEKYDVKFFHKSDICTVWDMVNKEWQYKYSLTKYGYEYRVRSENDEIWQCTFTFDSNKISILEGTKGGKHLKSESRLKTFSQIVMSMWALIQTDRLKEED